MRAYVLLLLLVSPSTSRAQSIIGNRDSLTRRVDSVFREFERTDSPGCAIGVYRDGRIVYARGYGMANLELGVPITPRTLFDIASIDKMFTATAVLLLAQEGRLSLEAPIRRYFPEMQPYADSITVRQMLHHVSGLRNVSKLAMLAGIPKPVDTLDFLNFFMRVAEANFPPGISYQYEGTGYALAEQLVYRVSGRNLAAFLRERVFGPLGMADTRLLDDYRDVLPGRAQAYAPYGTAFRIDMHQGYLGGNGGLQTSVEDFARWDRNWTEPTVGGRALVDSLVVRGWLRDDRNGFGVSVEDYRGLRTVHKGGWGGGFLTEYVRFPDQKLSVACFCNGGPTVDTGRLARDVATVYLGTQMKPDTVGSGWEHALGSEPTVAVPVSQLRQHEGLWWNAERNLFHPTRLVGDNLVIEPGRSPVVPLAGGRFRTASGLELAFAGDGAGTPRRMLVVFRGDTTAFDGMPAATPSSAQLTEFAGRYRSDEIERTYTLAANPASQSAGPGGTAGLTVRIGDHLLGTLEPTWRDGFVLVGMQAQGARFLFSRDTRGRITGFTIEWGDVRHLAFVRQR